MLPWRTEDHSSPRPVDLHDLPVLRAGRALKRWRYVGVFGAERMLCVGLAHVGGVPQAWWTVWDRAAGSLRERTIFVRPRAIVRLSSGRVTVRDREVRIDLVLDEGAGVETVCPHGEGGWIWTRKQAGVPVRGTVALGARTFDVADLAVVDDTVGYHARRTAWRWAAGVGHTADGRVAGWNLVAGVNDPPLGSERTVWIDGAPREAGPCTFAADLSGVRTADGGDLAFRAEAVRERHDELLLVRSDYRQPFGTFSGTLPGGVALAEGFGVMEDHRARW